MKRFRKLYQAQSILSDPGLRKSYNMGHTPRCHAPDDATDMPAHNGNEREDYSENE